MKVKALAEPGWAGLGRAGPGCNDDNDPHGDGWPAPRPACQERLAGGDVARSPVGHRSRHSASTARDWRGQGTDARAGSSATRNRV